MKITVLGCGPSSGVPMLGGVWGACDPADKKNRRRRSSIFVETANTRLLIDTPADLREQCLEADIDQIDSVLYTHAHADHTHGIDDLRGFNVKKKGPIDIYANWKTLNDIRHRFDYAFQDSGPERLGYKPSLVGHEINGPFEVGDISVVPFNQIHGNGITLGFRLGDMAYSTDVNSFPKASLDCLYGLDCWFVDCLGYHPTPAHGHLELTLDWISTVKPKRAILTHMAGELDYCELKQKLPNGVEPAFDGMVVVV